MGDIVYFKRVKKNISSSWTVRKVIGIKFGRDRTSKKAEVKYHNPGDFFAKIANKSVKKLVKPSNTEDMVEIRKPGADSSKSFQIALENARIRSKFNSELSFKIGHWLDKKLTRSECTRVFYFNLGSKDPKEVIRKRCDLLRKDTYPVPKQNEFVDVLNRSWDSVEKHLKEMSEDNYVFPSLMEPSATASASNKFVEIQ